jgi:transmembrane protein 132
VVAVTKSIDLANLAILTGTQISSSMRIFIVTEAAEIQDVTDQSHCTSAEPRILKVSPTCTSVYLDGSETKGTANAFVHIQYKNIRAGASFNVWYPRLPISVWLSDRTLNAVNDWRIPGWKHVDKRRKRDALQSVCQNRNQQAEVRVLVQFQVVDETTGEQSYLSGSRDLLFDVTQAVMDRVQSTDTQIIVIRRREGRLIATAKSQGSAKIVVKAATSNIDFGGSQISVSDERVSAVQLLLRIITDVQLALQPKHSEPFHYDLIMHTRSDFTQQYQVRLLLKNN